MRSLKSIWAKSVWHWIGWTHSHLYGNGWWKYSRDIYSLIKGHQHMNQRNQTSEDILCLIFSIKYNVKVNQGLCVVSIWINMHRYDDLFENNVIQKAFLYQLHYRFTLSCLMCLHVFCGFSSVNSTIPGWKSV